MIKTRSEQIAEGLRKSFQDTNCKMSNRVCYGYEVAENGELIINKLDLQKAHCRHTWLRTKKNMNVCQFIANHKVDSRNHGNQTREIFVTGC